MSQDSARSLNSDKNSFAARSASNGVCRILTIAGLAIGCLPMLARWWWIADLAANLRVQVIIGLSVLMIFVSLWGGRRPAILLAGVLLINAFALRPAIQRNAAEPTTNQAANEGHEAGRQTIRVCTNNVLAWNNNHDLIKASIDESAADVVAIVELSPSLEERLRSDLATPYPEFVSRINEDGHFGIAIMSKHPIRHSEVFYLCLPLVPSIEADIDINGQMVRVIATHPIPPVRSAAFRARNLHLTMMAERIRKFRADQPNTPVVLVGDLNLTPWSPHFDDLLQESGLLSASAGRGLTPTWYRWKSFPFGLVIDHGLHTPDVQCTGRRVLEDIGSDHRPVVFNFQL